MNMQLGSSLRVNANIIIIERGVFLSFHERGTKKKILSPHRTSDLRIPRSDALPETSR